MSVAATGVGRDGIERRGAIFAACEWADKVRLTTPTFLHCFICGSGFYFAEGGACVEFPHAPRLDPRPDTLLVVCPGCCAEIGRRGNP